MNIKVYQKALLTVLVLLVIIIVIDVVISFALKPNHLLALKSDVDHPNKKAILVYGKLESGTEIIWKFLPWILPTIFCTIAIMYSYRWRMKTKNNIVWWLMIALLVSFVLGIMFRLWFAFENSFGFLNTSKMKNDQYVDAKAGTNDVVPFVKDSKWTKTSNTFDTLGKNLILPIFPFSLSGITFIYWYSKNLNKYKVLWPITMLIFLSLFGLILRLWNTWGNPFEFLDTSEMKDNYYVGTKANVDNIDTFIKDPKLIETTNTFSILRSKSILTIMWFCLLPFVLVGTLESFYQIKKMKKSHLQLVRISKK